MVEYLELGVSVDALRDRLKARNKATDRVIVLAPIEGKFALNTSGLVDKRLFSGENKLHALQGVNGLWTLRYEMGITPEPLKQIFTNFSTLERIVRDYFLKRNVEVKEIID